ncbi:hypothetical protein PUMCH_003647 [Australozyma saopauloensis]|uniref:F-box domain-containing protein n=1 Tax=Australozyma saopauloensis TaxID=291208 RepID=A0AAX4HCJ9_9ASCO|nr:hypothetical protein PUMCH_003647 [[Candida] saopauloensis]
MNIQDQLIAEKTQLAALKARALAFERAAEKLSKILNYDDKFAEANSILVRLYNRLSERLRIGRYVHPSILLFINEMTDGTQNLYDTSRLYRECINYIDLRLKSSAEQIRLGDTLLRQSLESADIEDYAHGKFTVERALRHLDLKLESEMVTTIDQQFQKLRVSLKKIQDSNQEKIKDPELASYTIMTSSQCSMKPSPSCADPFEWLSPDLIANVAKLLSLEDVINCNMVCSLWRRNLLDMPSIFQKPLILCEDATAAVYYKRLKLVRSLFSSLPTNKISKLRIGSTTSKEQLQYILESVISERKLEFQALEVSNEYMTLDLLFHALKKKRFRCPGLLSITELKLDIKNTMYNSEVLLELLPNLQRLELVCKKHALRGNDYLEFQNTTGFQKLLHAAEQRKKVKNLQRLSIICNEMYRVYLMGAMGPQRYNSKPQLLHAAYPNLTEFQMANHSFGGSTEVKQFKRFLSTANNLKILYLENNGDFTFEMLFNLIKLAKPRFQLESLTYRPRICLGDNHKLLEPVEYQCLANLKHLDIYGVPIDVHKLLKLLQVVNGNHTLKTLNIGGNGDFLFGRPYDIPYIKEKTDLAFEYLLISVEYLILGDNYKLDEFCLLYLANSLARVRGSNWSLKYLDVSFCENVDDRALTNLLGTSNYYAKPRVETLVVSGPKLSVKTLEKFKRRGFIEKYEMRSEKWRQYGINSLYLGKR